MAHAERAHATLSPSGAHRWGSCTASALLEAQFPNVSSPYAEEGTLAHELCEIKVNAYFTPTGKRALERQIEGLKEHSMWSDEMIYCSDVYLDYIKASWMECPNKPHVVIERRVDLTPWIPEGSGIADCIIIGCGRLHIIDYKHGKGVPVSAEANPQLLLYALGALHAYGMFYDIDEVRLSIVQPRISSEVSTWDVYLDDLLEWGELIKEKARIALSGEGTFNPSEDACRFCRARHTCRARADHNVQIAFSDPPVVGKKPELLTLDEVGEYLTKGKDVAKWVKELEEYALSQALNGHEVAGWKAVEGRSSRDWTNREDAFKAIMAAGIPEAMLYETNPLSLAKIEAQLGKKDFATVAGDYVVRRPGKPTLVAASDKRAAISNVSKATDVFN